MEERIEATREQIGEKKAENYGFASFESVPFAHIVAKKLTGKTKAGSVFDLAPSPHDIIWEVSCFWNGGDDSSNILIFWGLVS